MKKHLLLLLALLFLCPVQEAMAQMLLNYATSTSLFSSEPPIPTRDVEILSDGNIKVTYTFSSALLTPVTNAGKTGYFWSIGGFGNNTVPTEAAVPMRIDSFMIPDGKTATVSVLSSSYKDFNYSLVQGRVPSCESGYARLIFPTEITKTSVPTPTQIVKMKAPQEYRGVKLANILVCPVQYISSDYKVRAYTSISYLVQFSDDGSMARAKSADERDFRISTMDLMIRNGTAEDIKTSGDVAVGGGSGVSNPGNPIHGTTDLSHITPSVDLTYAIITTDELKPSTENFAKWKKMQGYNVVTLSAPSWTHESAKNAVSALHSQYSNFYHLLIVGGADDVPGALFDDTILYSGQSMTDYPFSLYGDMDNTLPAISVGRIPLGNATDVANALYKIRRIEERPTERMLSSKATCVAYFDDENVDGYEDFRFTKTVEEIASYLNYCHELPVDRIYKAEGNVTPTNWSRAPLSTGGKITESLLRPGFLWNGSSYDISSSIKSGTSIMVYRGYGDADMWKNLSFTSDDVKALNNVKLPVILSVACRTGRYTESGSLVAELLKGRSNGSPCIIAPTGDIYEGVSDEFTEALIDARWPAPGLMPGFDVPTGKTPKNLIPANTIGEMFLQALKRSGERFCENWTTEYNLLRQSVHIFGDPSMFVNTEPLVDASSFASVTRNDINNINNKSGTLPQFLQIKVKSSRNVFIGLYNEATGETRRYYGRSLFISPSASDEWTVTVYDVNVKPLVSQFFKINTDLPGFNSVSYDYADNACVVSVDTENCDTEDYSIEIRDSFGNIVGKGDGSGSGTRRIPVNSVQKGVHIVSLLSDGNTVDSKHFLK